MEIITQTLITSILDTFIREWRAETMIAIFVFLLTYFWMQRQVQKYKSLATLYHNDIEVAINELKNYHQALSEIKQILLEEKQKQDNSNLLKQIDSLINDKLKSFSEGLENNNET